MAPNILQYFCRLFHNETYVISISKQKNHVFVSVARIQFNLYRTQQLSYIIVLVYRYILCVSTYTYKGISFLFTVPTSKFPNIQALILKTQNTRTYNENSPDLYYIGVYIMYNMKIYIFKKKITLA